LLRILKKEDEMKMIAVVVIVKIIIGTIEKNKKTTVIKTENTDTVIHPAAFWVR
jgi:hypothetical protein